MNRFFRFFGGKSNGLSNIETLCDKLYTHCLEVFEKRFQELHILRNTYAVCEEERLPLNGFTGVQISQDQSANDNSIQEFQMVL